MRISDWSSDVCSSDLFAAAEAQNVVFRVEPADHAREADRAGERGSKRATRDAEAREGAEAEDQHGVEDDVEHDREDHETQGRHGVAGPARGHHQRDRQHRSGHGEEGDAEIGRAPSELKSLMRTSYAVYCL